TSIAHGATGRSAIGRTSTAPPSTGIRCTHSTASARSVHSITMYPAICSFVSANGPSVTTTLPLLRRNVLASALGPSASVCMSTPALWISSMNSPIRAGNASRSSGVALSIAVPSVIRVTMNFICGLLSVARRLSPLHPNDARELSGSTFRRYKECVSDEDVALIRRVLELFIAGQRDEAWALWAEDGVGIPPKDWPQAGEFKGRDAIRAQFEGWNAVLGRNWVHDLRIRELRDLGEGRVLATIGFESSASESGPHIGQELATIYTVRDGRIVRAEFFMSWDEAQEAAGVK